MMKLKMYKLKIYDKQMCICKLSQLTESLNSSILNLNSVYALIKDENTYTLICEEELGSNPEIQKHLISIEKNYSLIKFDQKFGFTEIGVLSSALKPLADAGISILALSSDNRLNLKKRKVEQKDK